MLFAVSVLSITLRPGPVVPWFSAGMGSLVSALITFRCMAQSGFDSTGSAIPVEFAWCGCPDSYAPVGFAHCDFEGFILRSILWYVYRFLRSRCLFSVGTGSGDGLLVKARVLSVFGFLVGLPRVPEDSIFGVGIHF